MNQRSIKELVVGLAIVVIVTGFAFRPSMAVVTAGEVGQPARALNGSHALSQSIASPRPQVEAGGTNSGLWGDASNDVLPASTATTAPQYVDMLELFSAHPSPLQAPKESVLVAAVLEFFPPQEWKTALDVAYRESRFDGTRVGAAGEVCEFQIHPIHFVRFAGTDLHDTRGCTLAASILWRDQGWGPWR